jgi:hypothetical protein
MMGLKQGRTGLLLSRGDGQGEGGLPHPASNVTHITQWPEHLRTDERTDVNFATVDSSGQKTDAMINGRLNQPGNLARDANYAAD